MCSRAYSRAATIAAISALSTPHVDAHPIESCRTTWVAIPVLRTTAIEASRFVTDASAYSPRMFAPAMVAASLIARFLSLILTRWLWSIHGGWTHGGFPIGGRDPFSFNRSLATMHTALRGDMYRQTSRACGRAFLAGLLFGSDISLTICAITFLSRRSLVGSRKASTSRIGSDTAFYA